MCLLHFFPVDILQKKMQTAENGYESYKEGLSLQVATLTQGQSDYQKVLWPNLAEAVFVFVAAGPNQWEDNLVWP